VRAHRGLCGLRASRAAGVRRVALSTADAHGLNERAGFGRLSDAQRWLIRSLSEAEEAGETGKTGAAGVTGAAEQTGAAGEAEWGAGA
jgi:hypothetical protein